MDIRNVGLLATMPLLFRPERLAYWFDQIRSLSEMDLADLRIRVVTNTDQTSDHKFLQDLVRPLLAGRASMTIEQFWDPSDGKAMTWWHRELFNREFSVDERLTHFVCLEDDIRFSEANLRYWIKYRDVLGPSGFVPGFIRYEISPSNRLFLSDNVFRTSLQMNLTRVGSETLLTPHNPYAALYVVDKALSREFIGSKSFDMLESQEVITWPSTERSAMGPMFENPPAGKRCRLVVLYNLETGLPSAGSLVHHLPNTFARGERAGLAIEYGSLPLIDMLAIPE